ncbi:cytochrome P450 [Lactarius akahatsu]|uniref:Cytochrome P450 n=1 Tax=Lactarius akahatsu TaxID=416441 RepID=A0AAD4LJH1_9AGAM|nr:cytochrome P450 [Lactarius akahatsu]
MTQDPSMTDLTAILFMLSAGFSLFTFLYSRRRSRSLGDLRGPASSSFWLGNEADIRYQNEVGDCEFMWMREYGSAWRRTGCLGTDRLMLADPKALKHILHSAGYHYSRTIDKAQFLRMATGNGIVVAEGQAHRRQRKVMNPAFSTHQIQSFLPLFHGTASKLVQKWKGVIAADPSGQPLVNVVGWFSRASLDIIGEAGFDFQFGSLDNLQNPLVIRSEKQIIDSTLYPSWYDLIFKETWKYIPGPLLEYVCHIPTREYRGFRSWLDNVRVFSRGLIKQSTDKGDGNDIMSVLLRANGSSNPKNKMTDDEMVDQIATFLSAGQGTTAKSLTWYFYAIAKHPEAQARIREEIALVRARAAGEEFTIAELDSMTYTLATLKESMRLDPIVWNFTRMANRDDILPLAFPITTKSGQQITSIPIKKGTPIDISPAVYNRLPDVWGEDANEWNPERFLDPLRGFKEASSNIGVFGSLMSFSTGTRGCIGWQFAVLEMQIIILALVENFEFSLPPQSEKTKIYRRPSRFMLPVPEGQEETWMGLHIKSLN